MNVDALKGVSAPPRIESRDVRKRQSRLAGARVRAPATLLVIAALMIVAEIRSPDGHVGTSSESRPSECHHPRPGIHGRPFGSSSSMKSNWWINKPALKRSLPTLASLRPMRYRALRLAAEPNGGAVELALVRFGWSKARGGRGGGEGGGGT